MGPRTYRGPLALKKLYNKHEGAKGVTSPPLLHSQQLLLLKVWTFPFVWILYNTVQGADFACAICRDAKWVLQNGHHRGEMGPSESKGSNTREVTRCSAPLHFLLLFPPLFRRTRWTPGPGRRRTGTVPVDKHRKVDSIPGWSHDHILGQACFTLEISKQIKGVEVRT